MAENPIRSLLDLASVPIRAYRMTSDGRKWSHRCLQRRAVAQELASHANPDGSNIWASVETMAGRIGFCPRTFRYLCDELVELGFLINGKQRGLNGGRIRKLNVAAILKAGQSLHHSDVTLQDSVAEPCKIADKPCTINGQTMQDSAPNPATWPANPAPIHMQPTALPNRPPTAHLTGSENSGGWREFSLEEGNVHEALAGTATGSHLPELEKLLSKYGTPVMRELLTLWVVKRDKPVSGILRNKYAAFLDEYYPHVSSAMATATPEGRAASKSIEEEHQRFAEEIFRAEARRLQAEIDARPPEESFEDQMRRVRELG